MTAYELADILQEYYDDFDGSFPALEKSIVMLRQQADRIERKQELIREQTALLVKQNNRIAELEKSQMAWYEAGKFVTPQIKELSDEELNKAFDYYCETDEGVLRFNYELRDEWKKEQLIRWKEAFKKANKK
jgi:hypothetical protein